MQNKEIIQSYKYTEIRNDYGIYAQRLLVLLANAMQYRFEDANLRNGTTKQTKVQLEYEFKLSEFKGNAETKNHKYIREQLRNALKANVGWRDEGKNWHYSVLFTEIAIYENENKVKIKLNGDLWEIFVELSMGFKKYELERAMSFSSAHALKLYQLLAGNKKPIVYTIEDLKKTLGLRENQYRQTKDFVKIVIETATNEINDKAEYNIEYTPIFTKAGRGRPAITAIKFKTKQKTNKSNSNETITKKYGVAMLPSTLKYKLMQGYNFTAQGIKANVKLLQKAVDLMGEELLNEFIDRRRKSAMVSRNPQGYIINALKSELEQIED